MILLGGKNDGGYVLTDDFDNIKIIYSFGIGTNNIFEYSLAEINIDIYICMIIL